MKKNWESAYSDERHWSHNRSQLRPMAVRRITDTENRCPTVSAAETAADKMAALPPAADFIPLTPLGSNAAVATTAAPVPQHPRPHAAASPNYVNRVRRRRETPRSSANGVAADGHGIASPVASALNGRLAAADDDDSDDGETPAPPRSKSAAAAASNSPLYGGLTSGPDRISPSVRAPWHRRPYAAGVIG